MCAWESYTRRCRRRSYVHGGMSLASVSAEAVSWVFFVFVFGGLNFNVLNVLYNTPGH